MSATPKLQVVGADLAAAPYPADTRARGWRFDIDVERLFASSTWRLAPGEIKNALLRLWVESWSQIPAGSLPFDDREIAAITDLPLIAFQTHREVLLRGWEKCSDGRLYHSVIGEQVTKMLTERQRDSNRKATWRASKNQAPIGLVPADSRGLQRTPTESKPVTHQSVTDSGVSKSKEKARREPTPSVSLPAWLAPKAWKDYVDFRKAKRAPLTERAMELAILKLAAMRKGGDDPTAILEQSVMNGWTSLRPAKEEERKAGASGPPWWSSDATVIAKGKEVGLEPRPGESIYDFKGRVTTKLGAPHAA